MGPKSPKRRMDRTTLLPNWGGGLHLVTEHYFSTIRCLVAHGSELVLPPLVCDLTHPGQPGGIDYFNPERQLRELTHEK